MNGITAANDLGLTDAVPARVTIHTDARRRAIKLDKLNIEFKQTAPSHLCWAGRPAMRVVRLAADAVMLTQSGKAARRSSEWL